ncbi:unnamed protein product [Staurois parvus]|uniref:Uncharacterized protein n=1 Tax=Staurois parvus TaxID=386267 RepID=A0ABN9E4B9_9NEOB|nr:unnamed protein product [Staurois parvus]
MTQPVTGRYSATPSCGDLSLSSGSDQGWTDHLKTRALPEGPGSVGGPMRCPWYLFHRLF